MSEIKRKKKVINTTIKVIPLGLNCEKQSITKRREGHGRVKQKMLNQIFFVKIPHLRLPTYKRYLRSQRHLTKVVNHHSWFAESW